MGLSLEEAELAAAVLDAWCDGKATASARDDALRTLKQAIASGIQENLGRFRDARLKARPGMTQRDWELRAVSGINLAITSFRNAGHKSV